MSVANVSIALRREAIEFNCCVIGSMGGLLFKLGGGTFDSLREDYVHMFTMLAKPGSNTKNDMNYNFFKVKVNNNILKIEPVIKLKKTLVHDSIVRP